MKKIREILLIAAMIAMPIIAHATQTQIIQPISTGTGVTTAPTVTAGTGSHYGLDAYIIGGGVSAVYTPSYLTSMLFSTLTISPNSAATYTPAGAMTGFIVYNGSTADQLMVNPVGTASATTGMPIVKSSTAYDSNGGMLGFQFTALSVYNIGSATATVQIVAVK